MGALSKTKELCQLRNVTIRTLESDLGFGNGYIGNKTKDDLPFDRVVSIAEYFHVPIDYFLSDEETGSKESTYDSEEVAKAIDLYNRVQKLTPEKQTALLTILESLQTDV